MVTDAEGHQNHRSGRSPAAGPGAPAGDPPPPRPSAPAAGRLLFAVGAALAGLGVTAGAFGAHALAGRLPPDLLAVFETGARYHLTQSLGVLLLALAGSRWASPALRASGWLVVGGIVVFSGSLYLLAATGVRWLGAITPVGGVLMIAGWFSAAVAAFRSPGGA